MKKICFKKNIIFIILSVFVLALCLSVKGFDKVYAGVSRQDVATGDMFYDGISNQTFYVIGNIDHSYDEASDSGKIIFDKNKTNADSRVISTVIASDLREYGIDSCIWGEVALSITETLSGDFYIVFGLEQAFYSVNGGNFSAIAFNENNGKVQVTVVNIASGEKTSVYSLPDLFEYNQSIEVSFEFLADGSLKLDVGGMGYLNFNNNIKCRAAGYFGFAQSSGSSVEILVANVFSSSYDTPETAEVDENFEDGFDASRLFAYSGFLPTGYYKPEGIVCEEGVLKFDNIGVEGFISTTTKFSNFAMTLDIPHLQRSFVYDNDGAIVRTASNWIGISMGAPMINNASAAITQSLFFYMSASYIDGDAAYLSCVLLDKYKVIYEDLISDYDLNFWSKQNAYNVDGTEKTINLKVEMIDGNLKVSFKYANERESRFRTIVNTYIGYTPLGYLQIHGQGSSALDVISNNNLLSSNFWIDNLKIENKDENPVILENDFISSKIQKNEDYDYVDTWNNRIDTIHVIDGSESGCKGTLTLSSVSLAAIIVAVALIRRRKDEKHV